MTQWVDCHIKASASLGKPLILEEVDIAWDLHCCWCKTFNPKMPAGGGACVKNRMLPKLMVQWVFCNLAHGMLLTPTCSCAVHCAGCSSARLWTQTAARRAPMSATPTTLQPSMPLRCATAFIVKNEAHCHLQCSSWHCPCFKTGMWYHNTMQDAAHSVRTPGAGLGC